MIRRKWFTGKDIVGDVRQKYGFDGDIVSIFAGNTGPVVDKWHHYLPLYDRYFGPFRGKPLRFLEIGVFKGGSLRMWREFFGPQATIFGIDIDPGCRDMGGDVAEVRIGSQDDGAFLCEVVEEMGGVDIVLDDGSHTMSHLRSTLGTLLPLLSDGGVYAIEDLHTAYMPAFGGGYRRPANFFNEVRAMIDDMHHWYHRRPVHDPVRAGMVAGLHVHDSILFIDKAQTHPPVRSQVGRE